MFNIRFVLDDAIRCLEAYSEEIAIKPLPATVFLMQQDVVNHLAHALTHYFPLTLDAPFLQNSSLGTPYEKWAKFTNDDFELFFTCFRNLVAYTGRLVYESERKVLQRQRRFDEIKTVENRYTEINCDFKYFNGFIGIRVHANERIAIHAVDFTAAGNLDRTPSNCMERVVDITDRSVIKQISTAIRIELDELNRLHSSYRTLCEEYYSAKSIAEGFPNLIENFLSN